MSFTSADLELGGAKLLTPTVHRDERGWFMESYRRSQLAEVGIDVEFVQDNRSLSRHAVLRGLHCHARGKEQAKLVQVLHGRIFDVIVDLRPGSETFGRWLGVELNDDSAQLLFVPRGFAHGFQVLSQHAMVSYKVDREYDASAERSLIWNAPELAIPWPLEPVLSERDATAPGWQELLNEHA